MVACRARGVMWVSGPAMGSVAKGLAQNTAGVERRGGGIAGMGIFQRPLRKAVQPTFTVRMALHRELGLRSGLQCYSADSELAVLIQSRTLATFVVARK